MKLFLDLEETVITDIDSCRLLHDNIKEVKTFISRNPIDEIETFTFAMFSELDRINVENVCKKLSLEFGKIIKVQEWWTRDIRKQFVTKTLFHVNDKEMMGFGAFANKQRVFEWFCKTNSKDRDNVLIDDTVENRAVALFDMEHKWEEPILTCSTINIKTLTFINKQ